MPRKVKLYHYQLPLDCAMILRGQSVSVREGWVVELHENGELEQSTELLDNEGLKNNRVIRIGVVK